MTILKVRRNTKNERAVFRGWRDVVLLEEPRQYVYRMMLELGGAVVERWTVQHLIDLQSTKKLPRNLLIISRPKYLLQDEFRQFLDNDIRH